MKLLRFAVLAATMTLAALGADVTGKWKGQMAGRDGNMRDVSFDFKAAGTELTGSMSGVRGDVAISNGKIDGANVKFTVMLEMNGNSFKMNYEGTVDGAELKMKMSNERSPRAVEFLLKKL